MEQKTRTPKCGVAIEQRSQFTSVIANNGGGAKGIDALLAQLREQVGE